MWQEIVQIALGWGAAAGLVAFWYWVMRGIGTF
jgi:hypothetical protein